MKLKIHDLVPEELWIPGDSSGTKRHLTEEEWDLLFDWDLSPWQGHTEVVIAKTSWELNKNDIVLVRVEEYDFADIGIFVGYSSGRGKPMFACFNMEERHNDEINVIAGTGLKMEYGDSFEEISLEALKVINSDYFTPDGLEEYKAAVSVIEHYVDKWFKRRKTAAAILIQRWIGHCLYKPNGVFGKYCISRLYNMVAELDI